MTKAERASERSANRTHGSASRRDVVLSGVVYLVTGAVLALSSLMPWFRSSIDKGAHRDINGFRSGDWLLNVPIGWVVLVAGLVLIWIGVATIAPRRVPWKAPTLLAAPIVGAVTLVWIVWDRMHVHDAVRSSLEAAVDKVVKQQPKQAEQAKAFLASAHFADRSGLLIAGLAALVALIAGVWLVRRDRRPLQPVATTATAEA